MVASGSIRKKRLGPPSMWLHYISYIRCCQEPIVKIRRDRLCEAYPKTEYDAEDGVPHLRQPR